jgi:Lysozyme inhibitor LprI
MLMLRLTTVFLIWIASTACALEEGDADYDAELHEAYASAWNEADARGRALLAKAQRAWNEYRAANCELLGDECYALMAHERAAELRLLLDRYERSYYSAADADRAPDSRHLSKHER